MALIDHARQAYDIVEASPVEPGRALALQHARGIVQHHRLDATDATTAMTHLEACLAENLIWWHEHTNHKIVYWSGSHSAVGDARRVAFGATASASPARNAGSHLRQHFGTRYLSAGCTLHHGLVNLGTSVQTVPAPQPDRPDAILGTAGLDSYLLDLRTDQPPAVRAWLASPAKLRLIGPGYTPDDDAHHQMSGGTLVDWFDLIIHHHNVTATHALRRRVTMTTPERTERPMQEPINQPLGFWTGRAGEAIAARTQGALREIGVEQPEWWVLHQLDIHPDGRARADLVELLGHNDTPEAIEAAIVSMAAKHWATIEDDIVRRTALGRLTFEQASDVQAHLQAERMTGITDDEFVTTITVLQRVIANVGGDAWHW